MTAEPPGRRLQALALYTGGFLGPFGGGMVAAMLPEIGASYQLDTQAASATISAYLIPFAGLMLISGTIGERWGRGRSIFVAYLGYTAASILAALAPTMPLLLTARALQGAANAFTTPLLLAALSDITPPTRLGRTLGRYSAVSAAGQTCAPLIGGLAAESSWRWAFVGSAVVAALLALVPPRDPPRNEQTTPGRLTQRLRQLIGPDLARCAGYAAVLGCCLAGLAFLVAIHAQLTFDLDSASRGLLLTGFGIAGLVTGTAIGHLVDRLGPRLAGTIAVLVGGALVASIGLVPGWPAVALAWACCGMANQLAMVSLNARTLAVSGDNRGGALSVVQALRFGGSALAPVLLLPVYHDSAVLGFLVPGVVLAVVGGLLVRR